MKKKNRIFRIAGLLLVLCFISTVMLSGTFAKYTSEYSGQDTALVARWSLDVTDEDTSFKLKDDGVADLDLFSHLYDVNIIANAGTDKIIAPGVGGDFILSVTNNSDVAAEVKFEFEVEEGSADVPMEYSLDSGFESESVFTELGDLAEALNGEGGTFSLLGVDQAPDSNAKLTIYWRWPFDYNESSNSNDESDTALGVASFNAADAGGNRTSYTLKITAKATQVQPEIGSGGND